MARSSSLAPPLPVAATRVGADGPADAAAERAFCIAIAIQSAETVGLMHHVLDMTVEWMKQRVTFGRVIGSYQALKHRVADHRLWLEGAAGITAALADALEDEAHNVSNLASATKAHVGETAVALVADAVQIHGGIGVTWEHDLHLYLRRATANRAPTAGPPSTASGCAAWPESSLCRLRITWSRI